MTRGMPALRFGRWNTTLGGDAGPSDEVGGMRRAKDGRPMNVRMSMLRLVVGRLAVAWLTVGALGLALTTSTQPVDAAGELFTDIGLELPVLSGGDAAWGDYDADGDLDLLYGGTIGCEHYGVEIQCSGTSVLYRND